MNGLKEKIQKNEIAFGTMISEIYTPNVSRILKAAGFEFIIVDCEHGYFDFSHVANIVSICNSVNLSVLVRIPSIEREWINKVLDMGADGIVVPMVNNEQDAKKAVHYAKYSPLGVRGISTTRAHTNYHPPTLLEYMEDANKKTMVIVQLETREGIRNAHAISSIEGVDAIIIGPNDLSVDFGTPGQVNTEEMDNAINIVIEAASESGKASGIIHSNLSFLNKCRDRGMTVFSCNSEVGMILKAAKEIVSDFYSR